MKRTDPELIKELARRVDYDTETGHFTWKLDTRKFGRTIFPGKRAGDLAPHGYYRLSIRNIKVSAHIVAWYIVYGEIPDLPIDHINQDKSDNRIANLRAVPLVVNNLNINVNHRNRYGFTGVVKAKGKYQARIRSGGKQRVIGVFDTPEEAGEAYKCERDALIEKYILEGEQVNRQRDAISP